MQDITLQQLLEAGCHFGHKAERWHPKANTYIYTEKDGIHIIDLGKTKVCLEAAIEYVKGLGQAGEDVLFVATKRQAKDIVEREAERVGAAFITNRWIGGFLTNWEGIQKNITKIRSMREENAKGDWKKFPKHEQSQLMRKLKRLEMFYGGVVNLINAPSAVFIIDIKKELVAFREAIRSEVPVIALIDTNIDPTDVTYPIPSNDDAVGSITIITKVLADAFEEGKNARAKLEAKEKKSFDKAQDKQKAEEHNLEPKEEKTETKESVVEEPKKEAPAEIVKKSRGRPKKIQI